MKAKGKAKQLFCMVCVFVASFLITVTAFAEDISNSTFYGTYKYPGNSSQCIENHDGEYVWLRIYRDDENHGYYSGVSYFFKISNAPPEHFYAECNSVLQVNPSNGRPYSPQVKIDNYTATGTIDIKYSFLSIESITINSNQSANHKYVK